MSFIIFTTYHIGVTNFGDFRSVLFVPWYATHCKGIDLVDVLIMGPGF